MPRLQQIKRSNGSFVHSVNLPLNDVQIAGWIKGDELSITFEEVDGVFRFIIEREEDKKEKRGDPDGDVSDISGQE